MQENRVQYDYVLFQRKLPEYRVPVFRLLYEKYDIIVICCKSISRSQQLKEDIVFGTDKIQIPSKTYFGVKGFSSQKISKVLRVTRPKVVIAQFSMGVLAFWKLFFLKPFFQYKLIPWSHGISNKHWLKSGKNWRWYLSLFVYHYCDATLFYSNERRQRLFGKYPKLFEKSFVANNTLNTKALQNIRAKLLNDDSSLIKENQEFSTDFNLIFIGRLLTDKRLDLLIEAWLLIKDKYNLGLIIIGDGPSLPLLELHKNDPRFIATGAILENEESAVYLHHSHLMVIPGYVGLSIVHGFAFGLPLITCRSSSTGPFHSPEIEYLKDGWNGFLCDSTAVAIADCIENIITSPNELTRLRKNALETIEKEANIERMLTGFKDAIDYVMREKRNTLR